MLVGGILLILVFIVDFPGVRSDHSPPSQGGTGEWGLLIDDFYLLTHALLVNALEDLGNELG